MALNQRYSIPALLNNAIFLFINCLFIIILIFLGQKVCADILIEPVNACIFKNDSPLTSDLRAKIAQCLEWHADPFVPVCEGVYQPALMTPLPDNDAVHIGANDVFFSSQGQSKISGQVEVQQGSRLISAPTAYLYHDPKTHKLTRIELVDQVNYREPDRLIIGRQVTVNLADQSGRVNDALYRFSSFRRNSLLPVWGRALSIEQLSNKHYVLEKATYSTCAPQDKAWAIEADRISLDNETATGIAHHAKVRVWDWPVLYLPYLEFPISNKRKSGFLAPTVGITSVNGFDLALPYYWNIAPNYDATFIPHFYSKRGVMVGDIFRYLTPRSLGTFKAHFLPRDKAFSQFLKDNDVENPELDDLSPNRWAVAWQNQTHLSRNVLLGIDFQEVSDDYYLQDFSSNLAIITTRQLLHQGDLTYTTGNWMFRGMVQNYQTLNPINETPILGVYERLPQLMMQGGYEKLPLNASFNMLGQYDHFRWANTSVYFQPDASRYHFNPVVSFPHTRPWGFLTPSMEIVQNNYNIDRVNMLPPSSISRTIPRYYLDGGLFFERATSIFQQAYTQTLEPRLFYLNVPFQRQNEIPLFDTGSFIFNTDQLFRTNRYSGFDRIGDSNQLSYAVTTRWLSEASGVDRASLMVGQIRYFAQRRVQLCQDIFTECSESPLTLGYVSPDAEESPIASRAVYRFNPAWLVNGDYVWDPFLHTTNNADVNLSYQPEINHMVNMGYSYLINGDITQVAYSGVVDNPLHQARVSFAWPLTSRWSGLGAYDYNISKQYEMMSFFGAQYDSCCWAIRLLAGRTFKSLSDTLQPQYNSNVYFQVLLKGLGSAGNSDPVSIINTYLPNYIDSFHNR